MIKKFKIFNESNNSSLSKWFDDITILYNFFTEMYGKIINEKFNNYELDLLSKISDKIRYLHGKNSLLELTIDKYCKIQIEKMEDEWYVITTTYDSYISKNGYFLADGINDAIDEIIKICKY